MKRILYLSVISLLLMCFVSVACGDDDDDDNDDSRDDDDDDDADDDDTTDDDTEENYEGWSKIIVEPNMGWMLRTPRIAVDSQNVAHMVYLVESEDQNYDLYYAYMNGDQAVAERIDQLVGTWSPAIVLDEQNFVHLCYYNNLSDNLKYATNKSGAWVRENVNDDMPHSQHYDLAVDEDGAVYIIYSMRENENFRIVLADNRNGDWQRAVIWEQPFGCTEYAVGPMPRIGLDAQNNIHVSFDAVFDGYGSVSHHYLHQDGDHWIDEEILVDNMTLGPIEMTVEANGTVHMSCVRNEGGVYFLKYIRGTAGNWQIDYVPIADSENLVDQDFFSSYYAMDVDGAGNPHFAMRVFVEDDFRLLYMSANGNAWSREMLYWFESEHWIDLALDANGKAHIALLAEDEVNNTDSRVLWYVTDAL